MKLTPRDMLALGAFVLGLAIETLLDVELIAAVVAAVSVSRH